MKKRLFAALLSVCLLFTLLPATAFAEGETGSGAPQAGSALCEHHQQHDESCGYTEGTEEIPCTHEHDEDCYKLVTECVHEHTAECYPEESVSENTATPSEAEEAEPTACTHVCSEENGCITKALDCKHEHDEACGYVSATEGTPCTFVCEVCNAQDSGATATPSDAQPEECTCKILCTEDNINGDCPVCGAEGADLSECEGLEAQPATLSNALPATALAAENAPTTLYVGNYQITNGNATTYLKAGSTQGSLVEGSENDWTVKYDPSTATMTLNVATITGNDNISSVPYGAGIYAQCNSGQPVTLTIELIGENIITGNYGIYVNAEMSANSYGTDASLNITGNGSLIVTGTNSHGLFVKSGTDNASLTINDASVVANTTHTYSGSAGICVQSSVSATSSPNLSLAVDGGSLTASGTGNSDGILLYVGSSQATGATTSLTVTDNAIVRAKNGIKAERVDKPTPSGAGIVFDGGEGTVYGSVTLQENITIDEGESLTIPDGSSLTIPDDKTLTVNGGELTGNVPQSGVVYKVTEVTLDKSNLTLDVGGSETLTATITPDNATEQDVTWSSDPSGIVNITPDTTDSKKATVTATGTGTTTIKATVDGKSATCSVTVNAPATTITTQPSNVTVTEGETATFSVAATGGGTLTYQWQQSTDNGSTWTDISGATSSSYTTQAATMDMNGYQYRCKVTGTGGAATSDAATLTVSPKQYTVTVQTDGNGTASASTTAAAAGTEITLTATPDSGYHFERWEVVSGTITIQNDKFIMPAENVTVKAVFDRNSSGGGGSSRPTPSLSDQAIDDIREARPGDTVEITLRPGRTTLEREVFEELAGQDITLEIDAGDGVLWTVNGLDIPEDTRLHDLDLDVDLGDSDIPARVINAVTGEIGTVQLSLAHDGEFGFTMTLSAPLGQDNVDYWANLYWFNERTEELEFQQAAQIANDGTAEFDLDHASDYAIVIDDKSHEPVDLPFADVPEGYWAYGAIQYVYGEGLMAGTSGTTFAPENVTTRGQIVTILWRMAGSPQVNYLMDFSDVDPAAYYAEAIRWATSEGIAGGYGGGIFGPNDPITREQLAVMLHRYAQHEGYDVSIGEDTNILSYADAFDVSEYAVSALQWACGAGIISGTGDGSTLTPQGVATRAQVAVMLMRFCQLDQ